MARRVSARRSAKRLPELLTISDAAQVLGVSEQTLRRWDKAGKLVARRHPMNRYRLYSTNEILEVQRRILSGTAQPR